MTNVRLWISAQVRRFLADEFSRDPAVAAILRRDPPLFTSNHAPFFCARSRVTGGERGRDGPSGDCGVRFRMATSV